MRVGPCLIIAMLSSPVAAGAWLREEGTGFLSVGGVLADNHAEAQFYLEYGLTDAVTLGLSSNLNVENNRDLLAFVRVPLNGTQQPYKVAMEFGLGAHESAGDKRALSKVTLSYGRGFENRWGYGWFALDAAVEHRAGFGESAFKLDATVGQSTGLAVRPILQVETRLVQSGFSWKFAPGLMWDTPWDSTFVVNVERNSDRARPFGVRFGIWRQF